MFLKIMSYDIEVLPYNLQMPVADKCPIMLISIAFNKDYIEVDNNNGIEIKCKKLSLLLGRSKIEGDKDYIVEKYSNEEGWIYIFNDEVKMIRKFFGIVNDFGAVIVTGYNINGFDTPYIVDRMRALGVVGMKGGLGDSKLFYRRYIVKGMSVVKVGGFSGRIIFDVLYLMRREDASNVFLKKYNLKIHTLEHVSKEILGIEKLDFSVEEMELYWKECDMGLGRKMVEYGIRDAEIPLMLIQKFRLLDKFVTLAKRSGKLIQGVIDSTGSGIMVENLIQKAFMREDRVMSCRMKEESGYKEEELEGAFVLEPVLGVSDNIASTDYRSLYPTLMIKHNLCFSTLIKDDLKNYKEDEYNLQTFEDGTVYGAFIKKEIYKGIVPRLLEELLGERAKLKKEMKKYSKGTPEYLLYDASQNAVKILLNTFYGYSGDADAKIYSWVIASAVTTNGRKQIKATIDVIEKEIGIVKIGEREFKLKVIMSDTDSNYINIIGINSAVVNREEVLYCVNEVIEKVNSKLEKPMELAFEDYIKRIVIVAKKRYAMLIIDDDGKKNIVSKGLEVIRRDWCDASTKTMSKIIDFILLEDNLKDGVNKSIDLVKDEARKMKKGEISIAELMLTAKLTKPITAYDNKEPHVLVAIKNKERGKPSEVGDRIQYVIIDNGKELIGERAEDYTYFIKNKEKYNLKIDYNYYIFHQLIPPAMRVLELLGVKKDLLIVGLDEKQKSLTEWF